MITLDEITLPDDLEWVDRYKFHPAVHRYKRSLTGDFFVEVYDKSGGRNITLSGSQDRGWVDKSIIDALITKIDSSTNDTPMTLTFSDSETFQVLFNLEDNALEAFPVGWVVSDPQPTSKYYFTLRLITI